MTDPTRAQRIINEHVLWAVGAGLVPIPLVDIAAVTAIQLDMLKQLSTLYGTVYTESEGKAWVSALAGGIAARLGANALKLIPGIGSVVGGAAMSAMSGASTYALGQVAMTQFAAGKSFSAMDLDHAKKTYEEHLAKGKEVAAQMAKDKRESKDVFEKLEKLRSLRDQGVITAEDFEAQKQRLLASV
ncbi:MAG TPA: DUF697 domain-containing protein [Polyangiaceae bacterium]|jgi:uncharacterized protein (DUF697 family)|nr:DUF697 domain-containing protein [Polyangiaceae bacterium]